MSTLQQSKFTGGMELGKGRLIQTLTNLLKNKHPVLRISYVDLRQNRLQGNFHRQGQTRS